jgi:GT2 family glycosyltransferase
MTSRSITLVVPTLGNRPAWLADCLHSIAAQDGAADCRVIVVAPSSVDLAICDHVSVRVVRYDGKGLSRAVNYGWSLDPQSDYVAWLGDDDLLSPESLRTTLGFLADHNDCSMVYGRVRYIDDKSASMWLSRPTRLAAPYLRLGKNFLSQQGSVIRRSAACHVGWLDPNLMNAMDQDFFTRLRRIGARGYVRRELGAFRLHDAGITSSKGPRDESEEVRQRYWNGRQLSAYRAWRKIGVRVDWAADATMRRLPAPQIPRVEGRPYIEPMCHAHGRVR